MPVSTQNRIRPEALSCFFCDTASRSWSPRPAHCAPTNMVTVCPLTRSARENPATTPTRSPTVGVRNKAGRLEGVSQERWTRKAVEWNPGLIISTKTQSRAGRQAIRWEDDRRLKMPTQLPSTTRHHQQQHHHTFSSNTPTKTQCSSSMCPMTSSSLPSSLTEPWTFQ